MSTKMWFVSLMALVTLLAACTNPQQGAQTGNGGDAGEEGEQVVAEDVSDEMCDVEPPGITLEEATVGFSQMEENNPWRIAETNSIREEAEERGVELLYTDAQSQTSKQVSDIEDMIAQGVDVLIIAPREFEGLAPALEAANEADVPVFLVDREAKGEPCEHFITFMGSDFVSQGERAGEWLVQETGGEATIAELQGTIGASVTQDRGDGFRNVIGDHEGMEIVASQSGDFSRVGGQQVMEQLIQSNPDINAVYAHNDEMALGAIQALKDAGRTPGEDVTVVSVDGTRDALQAIIDGELGATVESNPRFGPLAFETIEDFLSGEPIPRKIVLEDRFFDKENAEEFLPQAY